MRTPVKVGNREVTVEEPSIYKTELIGDRLAAVGKDAPEVMSELGKFNTQYERDNVVELPRLQAIVQRPDLTKGLSESDWKQLGQTVKLPMSPSGTEQILALAPIVFTKARVQALELVALLMIPNDDLSRDETQVNDRVEKDAEELRFASKPSEMMVLISACTDLVNDVMEAHEEEVGKLRSFWQRISKPQRPDQKTEHEKSLAEVEELGLGGSGDLPSPIDSPPDTTGTSSESSTESQLETPSISSA